MKFSELKLGVRVRVKESAACVAEGSKIFIGSKGTIIKSIIEFSYIRGTDDLAIKLDKMVMDRAGTFYKYCYFSPKHLEIVQPKIKNFKKKDKTTEEITLQMEKM